VSILENPEEPFTVRERVIWALRPHNVALRTLPGVIPAFVKVLGEKRQPGVKMLYYDSAYMLGMLEGPKAPDKTLDVLLDFLREPENAVQIYVGKKATGGGSTAEAKAADIKVQETGMGDGRIMAVNALERIGDRVAARNDIIQELRSIAGNKKLWPGLQKPAEKLLKDLGK